MWFMFTQSNLISYHAEAFVKTEVGCTVSLPILPTVGILLNIQKHGILISQLGQFSKRIMHYAKEYNSRNIQLCLRIQRSVQKCKILWQIRLFCIQSTSFVSNRSKTSIAWNEASFSAKALLWKFLQQKLKVKGNNLNNYFRLNVLPSMGGLVCHTLRF